MSEPNPATQFKLLLINIDVTEADVIQSCFQETNVSMMDAKPDDDIIALFNSFQPDAILLDFASTQTDCVTLCMQIKANEFTQSIPIIALANPVESEQKQQAFDMGVSDFLVRPLIKKEIQIKVEQYKQVQHLNQKIIATNNDLITAMDELQQLTYELVTQSDERLQLALSATAVGIWEWDIQIDEITWTSNVLEIFGDEAGLLQSNYANFIEFIHPDDRSSVTHEIEQVLTNGTGKYHIDHRIIVDDSIHWIEIKGQVFRNEQGQPVRMLGIVSDITKRKETEQALHLLQDRYQKLVENLPGSAVLLFDQEMRFVLVDGPEIERTGFSKPLFEGKKLAELSLPDEFRQIAAKNMQAVLDGHTFSDVIPFEQYFHAYSYIPLKDNQGDVQYGMILAQNITEQRNTEMALRESEQRFRTIFDEINDAIFIHDMADYRILTVNKAMCEMYGYTYEEAVQLSTTALRSGLPGYQQEDAERLLELAAAGKPQRFEWPTRHKSGRVFWVDVSLKATQIAGHPRFVVVVRDITERKLADEAIRFSEAKFSAAFYNSADFNVISGLDDGVYIEVNDNITTLLGYKPEEVLGKSALELGVWSNPEERAFMTTKLKQDGYFRDLEAHMRRKDGEIVIVSVSASVLDIDGGTNVIGHIRDITARKNAEQALRLSEEKFAKAFYATPDSVTISTVKDGRILNVNQGFETIYGYSSAEVLGKQVLDLNIFVNVQDRKYMLDLLQSQGKVRDLEMVARCKTGEMRMILVSIEQIEVENEPCLLTIGRDITEQWQTQDNLRKREQTGREFQEKLHALHEVNFELSLKETVDELCYSAIDLAINKLGLERLGILFFDDTQKYLLGVYGSDESGGIRDEHHLKFKLSQDSRNLVLLKSGKHVDYWEDVDLKGAGKVVGKGWDALATLWDGTKGIGIISTDNYVTGGEIRPYTLDLLALYGSTLGHLITRKRAEISIQRYIERLQVLQQVDRGILISDSPESVAQGIVKPLESLLNCYYVGIASFDDKENKLFRLTASKDILGEVHLHGDHIAKFIKLLSNGNEIFLDDLSKIINQFEILQYWYQNGIQSMFYFPLIDDKGLLGVLNIGLDQPGQLNEDQLEIVRQVAAQLSIALRQADLYQQLHQYTVDLEHRVAERTFELKEKAEELEAFTYSVSHDLRAPLRAMAGFSRILMHDFRDDLPETAQHYLNRIQHNAERMGALIDALLNLSRINRKEMKTERIDLTTLVQTVVRDLESNDQLGTAQITIDQLPPSVGDPLLIKQVLLNLITNAIKYSQKRPLPQIQISHTLKNGKPIYFVKDNGVGYDARYADKLFGVFQRLHSEEEYEGTGIGLATVYRIIKRHGGDVWAESTLNEGATFFFTIGNK